MKQPPLRHASGAQPSRIVAAAALAATFASAVSAQVVQGPSSSRSPYLRPAAPNSDVVRNVTSILTSTDLVPLTGSSGSSYEIAGILDGLGAYDNADGTVTIVANHELGNTAGVARRHGAVGSFVSELIVDKNTLQVVSAQDLVHTFVLNGVDRSSSNGNPLALNRFCSSDLAAPSAFYNATTGLGAQDRIYFNGEEGGNTGWVVASVATGPSKGRAYILPRFNLATTPGVTSTAVGGWENVLASPFAQDLTVVAGTNDGGSGVMNNTVNIYVGTKQSTGNVVERAGLENGVSYFVNVTGNPVEIVNTSTRATNITTGTRFTLVAFTAASPSGTTFSRPEDGAWDPTNPRDFWFVTTDRLDTATNTGLNQTTGATGATNQVARSRLWRLRFDDITNPQLGGEVHLMIDGSKNNQKVNMLDNMCVAADGMVFMTEDPGNSTYLGKTWAYDPATDTLVQLLKFDTARWGELAVNGGTPGALSPWTNDKEISGIVDVTDLFPHAADEQVLLLDVQDHSTNAALATASSVEGGQLLLVRVALRAASTPLGTGCNITFAPAPAAKPVIGSPFVTELTNLAPSSTAFVMVGLPITPVDLAFVGLPGCLLYQDFVFGMTFPCSSTGPTSAQNTFAMPAAFDLTGLVVTMQGWGFDATTFQTSNALTVRIGL